MSRGGQATQRKSKNKNGKEEAEERGQTETCAQ
jgi:hypothetical protein